MRVRRRRGGEERRKGEDRWRRENERMSNQTVIRQTETEEGGGKEEGMCWFHYEFCNLSQGSNTRAK